MLSISIRGNSIQTRRCRKITGGAQIREATVAGLNRKHADGSGTRIEAVQEFPVRADGNIDIRRTGRIDREGRSRNRRERAAAADRKSGYRPGACVRHVDKAAVRRHDIPAIGRTQRRYAAADRRQLAIALHGIRGNG